MDRKPIKMNPATVLVFLEKNTFIKYLKAFIIVESCVKSKDDGKLSQCLKCTTSYPVSSSGPGRG
jgi:hypothetical protein